MAYAVLFPTTACLSSNAETVYANARNIGFSVLLDVSIECGQVWTTSPAFYTVRQYHFRYDTSFLGAGAIINSVDLWVTPQQAGSGNGLVFEVRKGNWAGSLPLSDGSEFLPGTSMAALPLLAWMPESAFVANTRCKFVNEALIANINKTAPTVLVMYDSRQRLGLAPPPSQDFFLAFSAIFTAIPPQEYGDSKYPKMVIDYTPSPAGTGGTITEYRRALDHL